MAPLFKIAALLNRKTIFQSSISRYICTERTQSLFLSPLKALNSSLVSAHLTPTAHLNAAASTAVNVLPSSPPKSVMAAVASVMRNLMRVPTLQVELATLQPRALRPLPLPLVLPQTLAPERPQELSSSPASVVQTLTAHLPAVASTAESVRLRSLLKRGMADADSVMLNPTPTLSKVEITETTAVMLRLNPTIAQTLVHLALLLPLLALAQPPEPARSSSPAHVLRMPTVPMDAAASTLESALARWSHKSVMAVADSEMRSPTTTRRRLFRVVASEGSVLASCKDI